jgi:hypothetical protein
MTFPLLIDGIRQRPRVCLLQRPLSYALDSFSFSMPVLGLTGIEPKVLFLLSMYPTAFGPVLASLDLLRS